MTFLSLHSKPEPKPSRKGWSGSGCCVAIFLLPNPAPHLENRMTVCMGYTAMTPQGRAGKRRRKGAGKPGRENGAPNINWSKWPTEKTDELTGRDSQIFACQLARSRSAEGCGSPAATSKGHRPFKAPTEPTGETSSLQGSKVKPLPSDMMLCVIYYWVLSGAKWKKPSQLMAILLVL